MHATTTRARARLLATALAGVVTVGLAVLCAPGLALAQTGPDPTLVVADAPNVAAPGSSGNVVQEFDSATGNELGQTGGVPVGSNPAALAITPDGSTAFVANNGSGTVTPVNVSTLSTQTNLCLPIGSCSPSDPNTQPEAIAVNAAGTFGFVANSGENSVSEITIQNGTAKLVGPQISSNLFQFPDALAISPDGRTLWVANYSAGTVVPVALPTNRVGTPINVGLNPTALAITPDGHHLLVANSGDGTVTDISVGSTTPPDTFALEPAQTGTVSPQAIAISPDGSTAYVTDTANDVVVPVTISSDTAGSPVSVNGTDPISDVVSPDGSTLYVADELSEQIAVFSLSGGSPSLSSTIQTNGEPTAVSITPDQAPDAAFSITPGTAGSATSFDAAASTTTPPGGSLTYSWDFGDGTTQTTGSPQTTHTYANPGNYKVTLTVTDAAGTSTAVVFTGQTVSRNGGPSATASQLFAVQSADSGAAPEAIVSGENGTATPVQVSSGPPPSASPGLPTGVGSSPSAVAIDPSADTAYVVDTASGQVTPVDMASGEAESSAKWITVGSEPDAIAITPDGRYAYVVNGGSTSVTRITLQTHATTTIQIPAAGGAQLDGIAITPNGKYAYVLDAANNTITPITLQSDTVGTPVGGSGLLSPDAIAIAPDGNTAYVVDGGSPTQAGGVTTVNLSSGASPQPVSTTRLASAGDRPDAIAVSPYGGAAYVADAPTNGTTASVTALSVSGENVTAHQAANVQNATALVAIAAAPDGKSVFATGTTSGGPAIVPIAVTSSTATPQSPVALASPAYGIAISPDQPPVAQLAVNSPIAAGTSDIFDASASSNPSSPIATYAFAFGDGVTDTTSADTVTHSYAVAGSYTATVTETDQAGTSTSQVFTGQTVSRNGSQIAVASQTVTVYPTVTSINPTSGGSGTRVTIDGTGFSTSSGATTIDFGTTAATGVSCLSTTSCTAIAPAGKGTVDVTVTVGGQTSPTGPADQFTYSGTIGGGGGGGPVVTSVQPNRGRAGSPVTINGSGFSTTRGATTVTFGSTQSASVTCLASTRCVATAPLGRGTVDVTVTVGGLTSPVTPADEFTYIL
jgi:VCBS repeat-containing protein